MQKELNAPKNQFNNYGKYKYRSVEDITQAVKPLLEKHDLSMTLTDEVVAIEGRFYVKATAEIFSFDGKGNKLSVSSHGYAREVDSKKGMDSAQLTGSCSSYARKYALGGLLLIDDNKDLDTMDNRNEGKPKENNQPEQKVELSFDEKMNAVKKLIAQVAQKTGHSQNDVHNFAISKINQKYGENLNAPTEEYIQEYYGYVQALAYQPKQNNQAVQWGN